MRTPRVGENPQLDDAVEKQNDPARACLTVRDAGLGEVEAMQLPHVIPGRLIDGADVVINGWELFVAPAFIGLAVPKGYVMRLVYCRACGEWKKLGGSPTNVRSHCVRGKHNDRLKSMAGVADGRVLRLASVLSLAARGKLPFNALENDLDVMVVTEGRGLNHDQLRKVLGAAARDVQKELAEGINACQALTIEIDGGEAFSAVTGVHVTYLDSDFAQHRHLLALPRVRQGGIQLMASQIQ
jgi:hypothetical protein